jgi:Cdc6-like AAA superfamily ATPase
LEWAERQRDQSAPSRSHVLRLLDAYDSVSALPHRSQVRARTSGVTVRALEPLSWLKKTGHADRIPEVWNRAVELAEQADEDRVTQQYVKQARSEFQSTLTPELQRQAVNVPRAQTLRSKAQAIVEDLWGTGNTAECKKFYDWFSEFLRTQQDAT